MPSPRFVYWTIPQTSYLPAGYFSPTAESPANLKTPRQDGLRRVTNLP